jgi:hypothetical protein
MVVLSFSVARGGLVFVLAFPAERCRAAWAEQRRFFQCGRISATSAEVSWFCVRHFISIQLSFPSFVVRVSLPA